MGELWIDDEKIINMKLNRNKNVWTRDELEEWLGGNHKYAEEYVFDVDGERRVTAKPDTKFIKEVVFRFDYETGENKGVRVRRKNQAKGSDRLTPRDRYFREMVEMLKVFKNFEYDGFRLGFLTFDIEEGDELSWEAKKNMWRV